MRAGPRQLSNNEALNFKNTLISNNYVRVNPTKMSSDISKNNYNNRAYLNKMGCRVEKFKKLSKSKSENNYFKAIHKRIDFLTSTTDSGQLSANDAYNLRKSFVGSKNDGRGKFFQLILPVITKSSGSQPEIKQTRNSLNASRLQTIK